MVWQTVGKGIQCIVDFLLFLWLMRDLPQKGNKAAAALWAVLVCGGLSLIYILPRRTFTLSPQFDPVFRFLYRFVFCFLYLLATRQAPVGKQLFLAALTTFLTTACQNIFFTPVLIPIARGNLVIFGKEALDSILCTGIRVAVYFLVFYAAVCWLPNRGKMPINGWADWAILSFGIVLEVYIKRIQGQSDPSVFQSGNDFSLLSVTIQVLIFGLLIFMERYFDSSQRRQEIEIQETLALDRLRSLQQKQRSEEEIARLHHDMKHHMAAVRSLAASRQDEDCVAYLDQLMGSMKEYESQVKTGSELLDGLIGEKLAQAEREGILFDVLLELSQTGFISDVDLCTIFGNALDNAMEACQKLPAEQQRFISVRSEISMGQLMIHVVNSCERELRLTGGLPSTTKPDREHHGLGVKSIRRAARKYGGQVSARAENGRFSLSVVIPMPEKEV